MEQWQLVWLITKRSAVRIRPPLPILIDMSKSKIDFYKLRLEQEKIHCVPAVCEKCKFLKDKSDEFQNILICPHFPMEFRNVEDFEDMLVPTECQYKMEHLVVGGKTGGYPTIEELIEEEENLRLDRGKI